MATKDSFMGQFDDIESLKNVSGIASEVTKHLRNVYTALALTTLSACFGVLFFMFTIFPPIISMIATIGLLAALLLREEVTDQQPDKQANLRWGLLLGFGFFQGASLGGLILFALTIDPRIVLTAFVGTVIIFGCLTGSALLAKRRSYLYLGGFLSSALMNLFMISIVNIFLRYEFLDMFILYCGLFVFCGYVLYDTHVIIEKVNMGSRDFTRHAAELFTDFVGIFIRILIILSKNNRNN